MKINNKYFFFLKEKANSNLKKILNDYAQKYYEWKKIVDEGRHGKMNNAKKCKNVCHQEKLEYLSRHSDILT
jgi:hypothetical protein